MVGPTRFELVTFCTPSKRATLAFSYDFATMGSPQWTRENLPTAAHSALAGICVFAPASRSDATPCLFRHLVDCSMTFLIPAGTVPLGSIWRRGFQPRQSNDWFATTLAHLTRLEAASPTLTGTCPPSLNSRPSQCMMILRIQPPTMRFRRLYRKHLAHGYFFPFLIRARATFCGAARSRASSKAARSR